MGTDAPSYACPFRLNRLPWNCILVYVMVVKCCYAKCLSVCGNDSPNDMDEHKSFQKSMRWLKQMTSETFLQFVVLPQVCHRRCNICIQKYNTICSKASYSALYLPSLRASAIHGARESETGSSGRRQSRSSAPCHIEQQQKETRDRNPSFGVSQCSAISNKVSELSRQALE